MLPKPTNTMSMNPQGDLIEQRTKQKRGTGFTNISRILGANVGAGQRMGQTIGQNLQSKAGEVKQGIEAGRSQFSAGKREGSQEALGAIEQSGDLARMAIEDQERFSRMGDIGLAEQGQKLRQAQYKGPQGFENAGKLQAQAASAAALERLGASSTGQTQLLKSQIAQRGSYGRGLSQFDKMLLGQEGQKQIQQGRSALTGIESSTQQAVSGAQTEAQALEESIQSAKQKQIEDIRNKLYGEGTEDKASVGLITQAQRQATEFGNKARRASELMLMASEGKKLGTPDNPIKEGDLEILNNLNQYNLGIPGQMYEEQFSKTAANVANIIKPDEGGYLFKDKQKESAANLAALYEGLGLKSSISGLQNVKTEFRPQETTYKEQQDMANAQKKYRDTLALKDKNPAAFSAFARDILGDQTIRDIDDALNKEQKSGFLGTNKFSDKYKAGMRASRIEALIRQKLRNTTSTSELMAKRLGLADGSLTQTPNNYQQLTGASDVDKILNQFQQISRPRDFGLGNLGKRIDGMLGGLLDQKIIHDLIQKNKG